VDLGLGTLVARSKLFGRARCRPSCDKITSGAELDHSSHVKLVRHRLPVRWEKTVIVVLDEVRISSPYRPENATGGNVQSLERVRKVVSLETRLLRTTCRLCHLLLSSVGLIFHPSVFHRLLLFLFKESMLIDSWRGEPCRWYFRVLVWSVESLGELE
jgi:hypothetical protein